MLLEGLSQATGAGGAAGAGDVRDARFGASDY